MLKNLFVDQITWKAQNMPKGYDRYHYYSHEMVKNPDNQWSKIGDYRVYHYCLGGEGDETSALGTVDYKEGSSSDGNETDAPHFLLEEYQYQTDLPDTAILFQKILTPTQGRLSGKYGRPH